MSTPSDTKNLWTQYNGKGFSAKHAEYAERASTDVMGHDLTLTMANNQVTAIGGKLISAVPPAGMYDLGHKDESNLETGNILAISCGNSNTELALTTVSTLTVLANPGVANFALLVDNTENSQDVAVTVKDSTESTTFYQSTAAGNTVGAGKICQVTCVGKCWTLAEFGAPA